MGREQPLFSVIIPTYARPVQLATCLASLTDLDYPHERFEVIVVDDGSESPTEAVVASFESRLNARLIMQPHAGPAAARNVGAAQAAGDFLAFTDDDCTPASDWLQRLAARFAATPEHMIGGQTFNVLHDNLYSIASQLTVDIAYAYYNADPDRARFFASNNLAVPTDGFRAIGGFHPAFTTSEDRELCDRWLQHGYRMTYAPEVLVHHAHPLTLRTFWQQHFDYGRGAFRFHRVRAGRGLGRFKPDLKFHLNALRYPLSQVRDRRAPLLMALLLIWQMANTTGFVWEAANRASRAQRRPQ